MAGLAISVGEVGRSVLSVGGKWVSRVRFFSASIFSAATSERGWDSNIASIINLILIQGSANPQTPGSEKMR